MQTFIPKLEFCDFDYRNAVNYTMDLFNPPITMTWEKTKYILPFGTTDKITAAFRENEILLIGKNYSLGYVSYTEINTIDKSLQHVFIEKDDELVWADTFEETLNQIMSFYL